MTDYIRAERLYIDFIRFRKEFMADAIARAAYTATNRYNEQFRPVVIISQSEAEAMEEKITFWQKTVDELEKYPELKIPKNLLMPLPKLIYGAVRVRVYTMDAVTVKNQTAAQVISAMEAKIKRSLPIPSCADLVTQLRSEIALLERYPSDERLRVRREGFQDTIANIQYEEAGEAAIERVSTHGLFLVDNAQLNLSTEPTRARDNFSVYDELKGITTAMWPETKIYCVAEVEEAKARLKDYRVKHKKEMAYAASRRSIAKRKQREAAGGTAASHREED